MYLLINFSSVKSCAGIATAQYVLIFAISFGLVISNFLFGWLATKIGSRKCSLILMLGSVLFTVAKYFARGNYWAFTVLSFVNCLFGSSIAVGNGYMCLIFKGNRAKIDGYIGYLMATSKCEYWYFFICSALFCVSDHSHSFC